AADSLMPSDGEWVASNALGPAAAAAVEGGLRDRDAADCSLEGRVVLLAGCGPLTRMAAIPFKTRGAPLIWASKSKDAAQATAHAFGGRQGPWGGRDGPAPP